jgi:hypothetical protein
LTLEKLKWQCQKANFFFFFTFFSKKKNLLFSFLFVFEFQTSFSPPPSLTTTLPQAVQNPLRMATDSDFPTGQQSLSPNHPPADFSVSDNKIKPHRFSTKKAMVGFSLSILATTCIFTSYNIESNLASTIHGSVAMAPMALLYALYIISSFLSPVFIAVANGRASLLTTIGAIGYCLFSASNIYGRTWSLMLGAICVGSCAVVWSAQALNSTKLSLYVAERTLLCEIQSGKYMDEISDEFDDKNHPIRQITDVTNPNQRNWYVSTIIDKNNRLISHKLSNQQSTKFKSTAAAQLGAFATIGWLFMQASSIIGALIAFGILHITIGKDVPRVYNSDTGSVRILYGVYTFISLAGFGFYFAANKVIPPRVFFTPNKLSKWDLHVAKHKKELVPAGKHKNGIENGQELSSEEGFEHENSLTIQKPSPVQPKSANQGFTPSHMEPRTDEPSVSNMGPLDTIQKNKQQSAFISTTVQSNSNIENYNDPLYTNNAHLFPGRAINDRTDDDNNFEKPKFGQLLLSALTITGRLALDPAILPLLFVFFTSYTPLSFTLSAFSSKGGVKEAIGVLYVPIFIAIVAASDVLTAFVLKYFITTLNIARISAISGLCIQLLSVILMKVFPASDWTGNDAWKYASIIGILQGIGDALSISGISTTISILCRPDPRLLSSAFSLLMTGRGLGLCTYFAITSKTTSANFLTVFWPIATAMISLSIVLHIIAFIINSSINVEKVLQIQKPNAVEPLAPIEEEDDEESTQQDSTNSQNSNSTGDELANKNNNTPIAPTEGSIELQSVGE